MMENEPAPAPELPEYLRLYPDTTAYWEDQPNYLAELLADNARWRASMKDSV